VNRGMTSLRTLLHSSLISRPKVRHMAPLLAGTLAFAAGGAQTQSSAVVDEGTFMVTRNGAPVGRESFRIVRAPGPAGQVYRATGTSAIGENGFTTTLGTDSVGVPVSYASVLTHKGEVSQELTGRGRPGRFGVLVRTKSGEAAREYLLSNGALLIDDSVIHHFYFVPLAGQQSQLTVIAPRAGQQGHYRLELRGTEPVEIAGRSVPSRHFALLSAGGAVRDVWVDEKGRLLKVAIPERGLVAVRYDPPR
jgi:hypothetical protein